MVMEFWEWITRKYTDWRGNEVGHAKSVAAFARLLGVPQPLMTQWMQKDGKIPRSAKYINALIDVYGDEAREVLGLRPPPLDLDATLAVFPLEWRERFKAAYLEYNAELTRKGIETDTPEARQIITEAFARHGVNVSITNGTS